MIKHIANYTTLLLFSLALVSACESTSPKKAPPKITQTPKVTQCTDPRPQICTKEYRPVCATKDTGIRCVTTPCSSTEEVTYSTGCIACSDPKVTHYVSGACH